MMLIAGAVLLVLGLASGVILVLAPFGLGGVEPSWVTWAMFPALSLGGYLFVALAARADAIAPLSRIAGGLLLALAVLAVVGLFLAGNAIVAPTGATLSLWYVLAIGLVLGPAGLWFRAARDA
jgi:hypothetical protein